MSDLAKRRDARDLWVSRSHLHAAIVFSALLCFAALAAGYYWGRSSVRAVESPRYATLVGEVPGTELVELLAEVERTKVVHASAAIEYPTFAADEEGLQVPTIEGVPVAPGVDAVVEPPPLSELPEVDERPEGQFTVAIGRFADGSEAAQVRDHLRVQGHVAWLSLIVVDGEPKHGVAVGGFETSEEADAALLSLSGDIANAPVAVGSPQVVELQSW